MDQSRINKNASDIKKTKATSKKRNAVTQVHEIISSTVVEEPKGKGKGSKSPRPPKVQASLAPASLTPAQEPKTAKMRQNSLSPVPQDTTSVAKKPTKSPATSKVTADQPVDVVMSNAAATTSTNRKKKQQLEESKTAQTPVASASAKKLEVMPSLKDKAAAMKKKISETLSNNSHNFT